MAWGAVKGDSQGLARSPVRRALGSAAVPLLVIGSLAAAGQATAAADPSGEAWTTPVVLSRDGIWPQSAQLAVSADGDGTFTWLGQRGPDVRVERRHRAAKGSLSGTLYASDPGQDAQDPQVAVARDDTTVLAWLRSDGSNLRVEGRRILSGGGVRKVETISPAGEDAQDPSVGIASDGDALFSWLRSDGSHLRVETGSLSASGVPGPVQTLTAAGTDAQAPQVAVAPNGDAVFTWLRSDGSRQRVETRRLSAGGVLGPVQVLSPAGQDARNPQVAVDQNGNAVLTWLRSDGANLRVEARTLAASSSPGAVVTASPAGRDASDPQLALTPDGDAVLLWLRSDGTKQRTEAAALSAAGALGPVQTLSRPGQGASEPRVAVAPDGQAVAGWARSDGGDVRAEVQTLTLDGSSLTLGPLHTVSPAGIDASSPDVGIDDNGQPFAAWALSDGTIEESELKASNKFGNCDNTSVGLTPLTDLGQGYYQGTQGGLYAGGSNVRPPGLEAAGQAVARSIVPLSPDGSAPRSGGRYGFVSIGMSIAAEEFQKFMLMAGPYKDPHLTLVNGAQNGVTANMWADPDSPAWTTLDHRLAGHVTPEQVAVVWVKMADVPTTNPWPYYPLRLQAETEQIMRMLEAKFPNLRLAYLSSRSYGGYSINRVNPEPYAYESGFAVKWAIQDQLAGTGNLNWNPQLGPVVAPLMSWGPYLWADGENPRSDGLTWQCGDYLNDGLHPSAAGRKKAAQLLLLFFGTDSTSRYWFSKP